MLYRKNIFAWEQGVRIVGGLALALWAFWMLPHGILGYGIAACGLFLALTGLVGWCPMCAMVGRRIPMPESDG